MNKEQTNNILKEISEKSSRKEFFCENVEEFYYTSGLWINYCISNMNYSKSMKSGRFKEARRICLTKNTELFKKFCCNIFIKECVSFTPSETADGLLNALLHYEMSETDRRFDGSISLNQGLLKKWW